jgi:hypothetical protein
MAVITCEKSVIVYQSTRRHIPEPLEYKNYEFLCRDESSDVAGGVNRRLQLPQLSHVGLHVLFKGITTLQ